MTMTGIRIFVPARPGLAIPMPDRDNRPLPADGAALDLSRPYYRRLLDDGDIVEIETETPPAASKGRRTKK